MQHLDPATPAGARALERLDTELMAWMTTTNPDGQPQTSAIWFLWTEGKVLLYSHITAPRNGNIEANPLVSFNLNSDPDGEEIVTMEGEARIDLSLPSAAQHAAFQAKHRHMLDRYGWTPEWHAERYPIPIVITPTRWRLG